MRPRREEAHKRHENKAAPYTWAQVYQNPSLNHGTHHRTVPAAGKEARSPPPAPTVPRLRAALRPHPRRPSHDPTSGWTHRPACRSPHLTHGPPRVTSPLPAPRKAPGRSLETERKRGTGSSCLRPGPLFSFPPTLKTHRPPSETFTHRRFLPSQAPLQKENEFCICKLRGEAALAAIPFSTEARY